LRKAIYQSLRLDRALRLVWKSAPGWTFVNLVLVILQGLLPLAALYLMKRIVDAVTIGVSAADKPAAFQDLAIWIILALLVAVLTALSRSLAELASEAQSQLVTDHVSDLIHAQSITIDLEYYENSNYYDTLHRAQQEATYRPTRIVNGLTQIGQNGISILGIVGLLLAFNPLLALVLILAALPAALVRLFYTRRLYSFEQEQTKQERKAWYYHWLMTNSGHAKEVRSLDTGSLFKERYADLRRFLREGRLAITRRRSLADFLVQIFASIAIFGTLGYAAYLTIQGVISVGDLVAIFMSFQIGLSAMQAILRGLAGLYEDNLFLTNFYQFLDLKPTIKTPVNPTPIPAHIHQGIQFSAVSFSYPNSTSAVLEDVDLSLSPGEVIALVGQNGSGKTTLVKLLCQLYHPIRGKITLDGIDLRQVDPVQWRRQISVLFQDYAHYQLRARENIWLGDVGADPDSEQITQSAIITGADPVINQLPHGYETHLGHWFEDGTELSTGEWQKIALARAFMRDARLIVLDEPTSSLDPLAEAELFQQFRKLLEDRCAVLISHRFSTVHMADCIYVMDKGKIVEQGSHQELLQLDGTYAQLYLAQAGHYQLEPPPEGEHDRRSQVHVSIK
jgi:ATP-binding cassette subfamily B protein